jgi:hypothetical protein
LDDIMAIKVKFFASLREQQPDGLKEVDANGLSTINDVWERATSTANCMNLSKTAMRWHFFHRSQAADGGSNLRADF